MSGRGRFVGWALVLFLAVTGLRIGEAIAVKWSDFEGDVLKYPEYLEEAYATGQRFIQALSCHDPI